MKVNLEDMTGCERIVLTKEQLFEIFDSCGVDLERVGGGMFSAAIDWPTCIEVEEVMPE